MKRKSTASNKFSIIYQSLYLANLLLLPGISFLILLYFFFIYRKQVSLKNIAITDRTRVSKFKGIAKIHLFRSIQLSIVAGFMLVIVPLMFILMSSQQEASVMVALFYFVTLHATFALIGMFNLSRAMANKLPLF